MQFSSPYKWHIIAFLSTILLSALVALVPPLLFRTILDTAIPKGDRGMITRLAVILVIAAIADAVLAIAQRWYSSTIGEGLIFDLRVALFDKSATHAGGFLHAYANWRVDQQIEQRRHRRPECGHVDPRQCGV